MMLPTRNDPNSHDLRTVPEGMQGEQREALESLRRLHREEMQSLTATMRQQEEEIRGLKAQSAQTTAIRSALEREKSPHRTMPRWPTGERGGQMVMGVSLALVLLLAPSGSAVTHAYEGTTNTAYGQNSLPATTASSFNSAFGASALHSTTTGNFNTASGYGALASNTTGSTNTAAGYEALSSNSTGGKNSAFGYNALISNTTGSSNTASGYNALEYNSSGTNNTAVGYGAGFTDTPSSANTTGSNNTFVGYNSGPGTASEITNATAIGANALVAQSNSIVLGGTGSNTQRVGVGTTTPHSALQIAKGYLQIRPVTGEPPSTTCATSDDYGRMVMRVDGPPYLYVCVMGGWVGR